MRNWTGTGPLRAQQAPGTILGASVTCRVCLQCPGCQTVTHFSAEAQWVQDTRGPLSGEARTSVPGRLQRVDLRSTLGWQAAGGSPASRELPPDQSWHTGGGPGAGGRVFGWNLRESDMQAPPTPTTRRDMSPSLSQALAGPLVPASGRVSRTWASSRRMCRLQAGTYPERQRDVCAPTRAPQWVVSSHGGQGWSGPPVG